MFDIFLIFIGLSIGNFALVLIKKITLNTAIDRTTFQFVFLIAIFLVSLTK